MINVESNFSIKRNDAKFKKKQNVSIVYRWTKTSYKKLELFYFLRSFHPNN